MKLEANKDLLYKKLGIVAKAVSIRPANPVLGNVLIKAKKGGLEIIGTDLDTTIADWLPAKVTSEGETAAGVRLLIELLATVPEESLTLELEKGTLVVKTKRVQAKIPTLAAAEFPNPPKVTEAPSKINKKEFLDAVRKVATAAAQDEGRPTLTGILVKAEKDKSILVATDGYRLAKKEIKKISLPDMVVTARGLAEVGKIMDESEEESLAVGVSEQENLAVFSIEHLSYFTKLISGEFPNFAQVIPTTFVTNITLPREETQQAIKTVATFAKELGNVVRLRFDGSSKLSFSASASQVGEGTADIDAKGEGQDINIAFNSRYLLDGIGTLSGDNIEMHLAGPVNPALLKGEEGSSFIYVVMPVRAQT